MYLYRTALESYIYTCTEQLRSQEYNLHVQNSSGVNYIYLYRTALESYIFLYRTVLESYIYLYWTALESGVLYTCTEQLWSLLNSQSKFCRTWRKPLEQWILRLSYTNPGPNIVFQLSFHQFVHSLVYSYVWIVTCTLYNHIKLNVSHCRWQGKIYAFHGLSKSYKHVHCP